MLPLYFSSRIKSHLKNDLEDILYFNKSQKEYISDISSTIEEFGLPKLVQHGNHIKIKLENLNDVQTIFAFDGEDDDAALLGLIIYHRLIPEEIVVLHISVIEDCTSKGAYSNEYITLRLINKLKEDAKRIKGVVRLRISYTGDFKKFTHIKIKTH